MSSHEEVEKNDKSVRHIMTTKTKTIPDPMIIMVACLPIGLKSWRMTKLVAKSWIWGFEAWPCGKVVYSETFWSRNFAANAIWTSIHWYNNIIKRFNIHARETIISPIWSKMTPNIKFQVISRSRFGSDLVFFGRFNELIVPFSCQLIVTQLS